MIFNLHALAVCFNKHFKKKFMPLKHGVNGGIKWFILYTKMIPTNYIS